MKQLELPFPKQTFKLSLTYEELMNGGWDILRGYNGPIHSVIMKLHSLRHDARIQGEYNL